MRKSFRMLENFLSKTRKIRKYVKEISDVIAIWMSGYFDKEWYLEKNPDVSQAKLNPIFHYLQFGGAEGRDPSPHFDSGWYLNTYEDVKVSGLNPLVHYLRFGKKEGRQRFSNINNETLRAQVELSVEGQKGSPLFRTNKQKIFCLGSNKTGTTSLEKVLKDFGYNTGVQKEAELLIDEWALRDFRKIIRYCQSADAFQDIPFSLDFTYQVLDYAFPDSKFILTVRNNSDEWYESLIRFHSKILGLDRIPTPEDLKKFVYHYRGYLWCVQKYVLGIDETTLYNKDIYKANYENHNNQIMEYFRFRENDLLVLNISDSTAMQTLCKFLGVKYTGQEMPHLNRSKD